MVLIHTKPVRVLVGDKARPPKVAFCTCDEVGPGLHAHVLIWSCYKCFLGGLSISLYPISMIGQLRLHAMHLCVIDQVDQGRYGEKASCMPKESHKYKPRAEQEGHL